MFVQEFYTYGFIQLQRDYSRRKFVFVNISMNAIL